MARKAKLAENSDLGRIADIYPPFANHAGHPIGRSSQLLVGNPANFPADERIQRKIWRKSQIGTQLEKDGTRIGDRGSRVREKGDWTMSGLKFERHLIAAFAALLMSTIAVGAAVTPAQVSAAPLEVVTYA